MTQFNITIHNLSTGQSISNRIDHHDTLESYKNEWLNKGHTIKVVDKRKNETLESVKELSL